MIHLGFWGADPASPATPSRVYLFMPRRSNNFQRLVYLIQRILTPGWEVTESEMLVDRITKEQREVDIVIRGNVGPHPFLIGIECAGRKRKAGVEWVEQLAKKHETLTDKLILVSERGFYRTAEAKAKQLGVQTHSFGVLLKDPGATMRDMITVGWVKLDGNMECSLETRGREIEVDANSPIFAPNGTEIGSINAIMREHVKEGRTIEAAQRGADGFGIDYTFHPGSWIENSRGERMLIDALHVRSKLMRVERVVPAAQGEFAGHAISHGVIGESSPPLNVVFVTHADGRTETVFDPPNVTPPGHESRKTETE